MSDPRAQARAFEEGAPRTNTTDCSSTHTCRPLHKGAGPPPQRAGNQPTDSDHDALDCALSHKRLDGDNTSADDTRDSSRARSDDENTTPTTTHKIERVCARALTTAPNGRSETERADPVRQHSREVMCTHWPPTPTALHLQWRGLLSRGGRGATATRSRTKA
jgi:hypothetical protein